MQSARFRFHSLAFLFSLSALFVLATAANAEVIRVASTHVSLEPPTGFLPATGFAGFDKRDQGASILVSEVGLPFSRYRESFTREALDARGLFLLESGRWTIDGRDGLLMRVTDPSNEEEIEAWILIFGDISRSVMIVGSYPRDYATFLSPSVRRSILTAQWDLSAEIGTFEGLPFKVDESENLKIASRAADSVVLTPSGRPGRPEPEDAFLVVGTSIGQFDFGNLEAYSRRELEDSGLVSRVTHVRGTLTEVDGMTGYELTANAMDAASGTPLTVYQLVLGEGQRQYWVKAFVGQSQAARFLPEFRAVAESLRRAP